jgi:hypothetical protein
MLERFPLLQPEAFHHPRHAVGRSEIAHEVVLKRNKKPGKARIPLPRAASAQLPVDAPGVYAVKVSRGGEEREAPEYAFSAAIDPRESDVTRRGLDELQRQFGGEEHAMVAGGADAALPTSGTPLWPWLLVAMVAALVAEGVLVRRA